MFDELERVMPAPTEHLNSFEEGQLAFVRGQRARCLVDEGRAKIAVPLLEATENYYEKSASFDSDLLRLRFSLADAYDRADRIEDARQLFESVVSEYERRSSPSDKELQVVHERWAQFLVEQGKFAQAEPILVAAIKQASGSGSSVPARAYGDLASAAIAQDQIDRALEYSEDALQSLKSTSDLYNIRVTTLLWRIRGQALLLSGDLSGAQGFAERSLVGDQKYDDPSSPDITADRALLKQIQSKKSGSTANAS